MVMACAFIYGRGREYTEVSCGGSLALTRALKESGLIDKLAEKAIWVCAKCGGFVIGRNDIIEILGELVEWLNTNKDWGRDEKEYGHDLHDVVLHVAKGLINEFSKWSTEVVLFDYDYDDYWRQGHSTIPVVEYECKRWALGAVKEPPEKCWLKYVTGFWDFEKVYTDYEGSAEKVFVNVT